MLLFGLSATITSIAQTSSSEFWPEVDLWYRLNPSWRLSEQTKYYSGSGQLKFFGQADYQYPARSFGPAIISRQWDGWWIYLIGPLAGALLASLACSLPATPEIAIEHVFDAIQENHRFWKIDPLDVIKVNELRSYLELNYSSRIHPISNQYYSSSFSNLSTVYHCITYLTNNNIQEINRLYPKMPNENDATYPDFLFNKLEAVYTLIPPTFDAFMYYAFPTLREKVSFWDGFDLISINFIIRQNNYFIIFHYFKRVDGAQVRPQLIFTRDFKHELYKKYSNNEVYNQDYFKTDFKMNDIDYKLHLIHGDDIYLSKRRFSIFNQLYNFLIRRFNHNYLKRDNQISPASLI